MIRNWPQRCSIYVVLALIFGITFSIACAAPTETPTESANDK